MNEDLQFTLEDVYSHLQEYQVETLKPLVEKYGVEETARLWLTTVGPSNSQHLGGAGIVTDKLWEKFKAEFKKLICGREAYKKEHSELLSIDNLLSQAGATYIAGVISQILDISVVVLLPAVLLMLEVVAKMGKNIYCENYKSI